MKPKVIILAAFAQLFLISYIVDVPKAPPVTSVRRGPILLAANEPAATHPDNDAVAL